jgi:NADH-quinone oxidoreductase subunit I
MTRRVPRPNLTWYENLYFPAIWAGVKVTARHFWRTFARVLTRRKHDVIVSAGRVTMEYPEEKWTVSGHYRGAPALVKDPAGRVKCVACQLCEFVCPPRAIRITPEPIPASLPNSKVEKWPKEFDIDMLRCIYCGLCEEVCPEEAIFLGKEYALVGETREALVHDKEELLRLGGIHQDNIYKWKNK